MEDHILPDELFIALMEKEKVTLSEHLIYNPINIIYTLLIEGSHADFTIAGMIESEWKQWGMRIHNNYKLEEDLFCFSYLLKNFMSYVAEGDQYSPITIEIL